MIDLSKATPDELAQTFSFARRFNGRERMAQGGQLMARITDGRLIAYLERSGFVV